MLNRSIGQLQKLAGREDPQLTRWLEDADSSMMQIFTKRMQDVQGDMTEGEKFQRIKEFKQYLLEEFNMSEYLIEKYINAELSEDNYSKLLRYDRIINKYTTKFKLSKKERYKYTLHEPRIDMNDKRNILNKD